MGARSFDFMTLSVDDEIPDSAMAFGLEARVVRAGLRTDYDIGRVYRLTSAATLAGAGLAMGGALKDPGLKFHQRLVAGGAGAVYMLVGLIGVWGSPSHVALWFQRRPRRALCTSAVPLLLLAPSGGIRSPLHRLATVGVGAAAGVRERRVDGQVQAILAGLVWAGAALVTNGPSRMRWRDQLNIAIGFVLASAISATASQVAYDSRNLFDQLFEFAYEREDLEPYEHRLKSALEKMRESLLEAAAAEPHGEVDKDDLTDQVIASLGRLEERLGVLEVAATSRFDLDSLVRSIRPTLVKEVDLATLASAIVTGSRDLETLLEKRVRVFTDISADAPALAVTVDRDVEVRGLQRLALIGATVTAGATNAVRHAAGMSYLHVHLSRTGEDLQLEVTNDGVRHATSVPLHPRSRSGLTHLKRRIEDFASTTPSFGPIPGGAYRMRIALPAESEPNQPVFWAAEIGRQVAASLRQGTMIAAAKSCVNAFGMRHEEQTGVTRRARPGGWRPAHALLPVAVELLAWRGYLRNRRVDVEAIVLAVAAVLNGRAVRSGSGLSTTWVSGFASRYAFEASPDAWKGWAPRDVAAAVFTERSQQRAYALAALNAIAIFAASRGGGGKSRLWGRDVVSVGLGPFLMCAIVNPAQPRIRLLDRAINEQLAEVESLYELADSIHAEHPAPPKIRDLTELVADVELSARLRAGLDEIEHAEDALLYAPRAARKAVVTREPLDRLGDFLRRPGSRFRDSQLVRSIWPEPQSYYSPSVGMPDAVRLGEYLARGLGRRIWPARVLLEFDDSPSLDFAPQAAIHSAAFRHKAVAAMEIAGRELCREFGRRWDGIWLLRRVDFQLRVVPYTGSLECRLTAWAPRASRWRGALDRLSHSRAGRLSRSAAAGPSRPSASRVQEVERLLGEVDASLLEWDIYDEDRLDDAVSLPPPSGHQLRSIRRAGVTVQLHPQRYSRQRIDFARRAGLAPRESIS